MRHSTFFWLLILAALVLALLVEAHTGHLGHFSLFMAGVSAGVAPALPTTDRIERVLTVYSDNDAGRAGLLMTRDEAEQYARSVVGQYLTMVNSGHGGIVLKEPSKKHGVSCGKIIEYRLDDFPAHPGVGRVLVICERC
jgi:hypothetical protein